MEFQHSVIIRASAGTGKTHQLSGRFLQILWRAASVDRVLATTFTRKAAGEIFARILRRLAAATVDPQALAELRASLGKAVTVAECHEKLADLSRSLHRVRVGTLDAHFAELARSLAFEIGLPAQWQIVDEAELGVLQGRALEQMLCAEGQQFGRELVQVLGYGEAVRGIGDMLRRNIEGHYDFFREGSFESMQGWLTPLLHLSRLNDIELAAALEDARHAELPSHKTIEKTRAKVIGLAKQRDWEAFLESTMIVALWEGKPYCRKQFSQQATTAFAPLIEHARAMFLRARAAHALSALRLFQQFDQHFDALKRRTRWLTFNDLPRALLSRAGDEQAEFRMNGRIQHLLLDEFQDTSAAQWQVLLPLVEQITSRRLPDSSFFCVGDIKQAIYGWRGATSDILADMSDRLPGCDTANLDANRRSAQPIIDVVNQVFQGMGGHQNLGQYEKLVHQWSAEFPTHTTTKSPHGYVCLQTTAGDNDESVWERTAEVIASRLAESPGLDVGVLVRENKAIPPIIAALRDRGIVASEEGGNALTDSLGVRIILALLRLIDHPGCTADAFLVAHSPLGESLEMERDVADPRSGQPAIGRVVRRLREDLHRRGLGSVVTDWITALLTRVSLRESSRLWQLVDLAYEYEPRMRCRCKSFVRFVEERKVSDPASTDVRVMTVHQAKGLEFDCVVLNQLDGDLVRDESLCFARRPTDYAPDRFVHAVPHKLIPYLPENVKHVIGEDLRWRVHDALCVLYVAMTRARHELQILVQPNSSNKHRKSSAGLICAALIPHEPLVADSILFEQGHPDWHAAFAAQRQPDKQQARGEPESPDEPTIVARRPIHWAAADGAPAAVETIAPSNLEGESRVNLGSVFSTTRREAMAFGRLIHAWFEQIEWLKGDSPSGGQPSDRHAIQHAARLGVPLEAAKAALNRFRSFASTAASRELLVEEEYRRATRVWLESLGLAANQVSMEVRREQPIAHLDTHPGRVLSGTIDRLIIFRQPGRVVAADVVDYKTDPCERYDESYRTAKQQFYAPQMAAYADAVATMFRVPRPSVRTRLLMVDPGAFLAIESAQRTALADAST